MDDDKAPKIKTVRIVEHHHHHYKNTRKQKNPDLEFDGKKVFKFIGYVCLAILGLYLGAGLAHYLLN